VPERPQGSVRCDLTLLKCGLGFESAVCGTLECGDATHLLNGELIAVGRHTPGHGLVGCSVRVSMFGSPPFGAEGDPLDLIGTKRPRLGDGF